MSRSPSTSIPRQKQKLTPPDLARLWGKKPSTIVALIRSGDLGAIDVRTPGKKRPRYLIDQADVDAFEARRVVSPASKPVSQRKQAAASDPDWVKYF